MIEDPSRTESKSKVVGRNVLLTLGIVNAYSLLVILLHLPLSLTTEGRVFHGKSGELTMLALLSLPQMLAAPLAGYLAGIYLRFRGSNWALVLVALMFSVTYYNGHAFGTHLEPGEVLLFGTGAALIFALMLSAFLWRRRRAPRLISKRKL